MLIKVNELHAYGPKNLIFHIEDFPDIMTVTENEIKNFLESLR